MDNALFNKRIGVVMGVVVALFAVLILRLADLTSVLPGEDYIVYAPSPQWASSHFDD